MTLSAIPTRGSSRTARANSASDGSAAVSTASMPGNATRLPFSAIRSFEPRRARYSAPWPEDDLDLFRQRVSGRKVAVAVNEDAADDEYRISRRRNLRHPARYLSLPTRSRDEIVARFRTCGACADVGKNRIVRC